MIYVLKWIKENLGPVIQTSIQGTAYTEDWLAAIACRETGFLIARYAGEKLKYDVIAGLMKGDYDKRPNDVERIYHGFGFWQIDIGSFPDFVKSGDWKDASKTCAKAIQVLNSKRKYLTDHLGGLSGETLDRAVTAAYNCGEGMTMKAIINHQDVDHYTFNRDYSKSVWEYREQYKQLP